MEIVYIGDPMCSWCYGISEELAKVKDHFEGRLEFKLVVGGLRPGGGDEWNDNFKDFLKHHWEEVNTRSGVSFSYDIFNKEDFLYDTEPSCRATVIARDMNQSIVLDFFYATQKGFYFENKDPKDVNFYKSICHDLKVDFEDFKARFQSDKYKNLTVQDFQYASQIGVRSFPTVMLNKNGMLIKVANGFATSAAMIAKIEQLIVE